MDKVNVFNDPSAISLIIANCIPIIGILFFEWSLFSLLIFYWLESAIIGVYNILKMWKAGPTSGKNEGIISINGREIKLNGALTFGKIGLIAFFMLHYGMFMFGHLTFIIVISALFKNGTFNLMNTIIQVLTALIFLAISHGISYYKNFICNKEYEKTNIGEVMMSPYKRIIVMHITLLLGMIIIGFSGLPIFVAILFIVLKTGVDIYAHGKEHNKKFKMSLG